VAMSQQLGVYLRNVPKPQEVATVEEEAVIEEAEPIAEITSPEVVRRGSKSLNKRRNLKEEPSHVVKQLVESMALSKFLSEHFFLTLFLYDDDSGIRSTCG